jgi:hypothetical protein
LTSDKLDSVSPFGIVTISQPTGLIVVSDIEQALLDGYGAQGASLVLA